MRACARSFPLQYFYFFHNILLKRWKTYFAEATISRNNSLYSSNNNVSGRKVCVRIFHHCIFSMCGLESLEESKTNGIMLPLFPQFSCLSGNDLPVTEHNLASPLPDTATSLSTQTHTLWPPHMHTTLPYPSHEHTPLQPRGIHFLIFLDWENNTHALTMLTSLMPLKSVVMELWLLVSGYPITGSSLTVLQSFCPPQNRYITSETRWNMQGR